jgi:hypothetical protein
MTCNNQPPARHPADLPPRHTRTNSGFYSRIYLSLPFDELREGRA